MQLIERANVIHYHRKRLAEFGASVRSLGWRGQQSQIERFKVITGCLDLTDCSILDVGCGRGDLRQYLEGVFSGFSYVGVDQMPEFIKAAQARFSEDTTSYFYQADVAKVQLPQADYVVASGLLSYRSIDTRYYYEMIAHLYGRATQAFVFNMLDEKMFGQEALLTGHNKYKVVNFCRSLCAKVELICGYLEDDFTVCMHR